jgi:hypothetical protein
MLDAGSTAELPLSVAVHGIVFIPPSSTESRPNAATCHVMKSVDDAGIGTAIAFIGHLPHKFGVRADYRTRRRLDETRGARSIQSAEQRAGRNSPPMRLPKTHKVPFTDI